MVGCSAAPMSFLCETYTQKWSIHLFLLGTTRLFLYFGGWNSVYFVVTLAFIYCKYIERSAEREQKKHAANSSGPSGKLQVAACYLVGLQQQPWSVWISTKGCHKVKLQSAWIPCSPLTAGAGAIAVVRLTSLTSSSSAMHRPSGKPFIWFRYVREGLHLKFAGW